MALSALQLGELWVKAGGDPKEAGMAAAIAQAESGGNASATNHNTNGTTDRGLWQINSIHGAQSTFDQLANAKAAVAISNNGKDWGPWSTYTNGAYKPFFDKLPDNIKSAVKETDKGDGGGILSGIPVVGGLVSGAASAASGTASALGSIAAFFKALGSAAVWFRVGKVLVGVFLGLFGIIILVKPKVTV